MRAHPVGFLLDRASVFRVAALQARVKHDHPAAIAAAGAIVVLVHDALSESVFQGELERVVFACDSALE
jgi:ADP-ribosylglycohydrolase